MAQFYAYARGSRGETHRLGGKESGAEAGARGWDFGGRACIDFDKELKKEVVSLYLTGGSSGGRSGALVGRFIVEDGEYKQISKADKHVK